MNYLVVPNQGASAPVPEMRVLAPLDVQCLNICIYIYNFSHRKHNLSVFYIEIQYPARQVACCISNFSACNFNTLWTLGLNND